MYNETTFLQYGGVFFLFCIQAGNFNPTYRKNRELKVLSVHSLEYLASRLTNAAWSQLTV